MRLLLDTHAMLWFLNAPSKLRSKARSAIASPRNKVFVSTVSIWEAMVKKSIGKLAVKTDLIEEITKAKFEFLDIHPRHALGVGDLPRHHDDPFDRMLITQAIIEELKIVTRDETFERYDVDLLPA